MKASAMEVLNYLGKQYPRFVSVPELISTLRQSDIRKRVSELKAEGLPVEKERTGRFVNYRCAPTRDATDYMTAHDCFDNAVEYASDGPLGHGWECGVCGKFLQAG